MLKLNSLKFQNIGRFVEPQEIDFSSLGQLIQIDGQNENTGGSSGSGKSTIFQAISWLLGLDSHPTTILQSRLTKDAISVEASFDWDGKQVVIKRSKKLSIIVDSVEFSGASKVVEEKLDEILGLSRSLFSKMLHRKQGDSGFFLQMTPSQMNQFLTDCLGLNHIRSKIDSVELKTKELVNAVTKEESDLEAIKAGLKATQEAVFLLGNEPLAIYSESNIKLLEQEVGLFEKLLNDKVLEHKKEKEELEKKKPKISMVPFDRTLLNNINNQIEETNSKILEILESEKNRQAEISKIVNSLRIELNSKVSSLKVESNSKISEIKNQIVKLQNVVKTGASSKEAAIKIANQIKLQRSGICHTCEQSWVTESAKKEEQKLLTQLSEHKINIENASNATKQIEELNSDLLAAEEGLKKEIELTTKQKEQEISSYSEQLKAVIPPELLSLKAKRDELNNLKEEQEQKQVQHSASQNEKNEKVFADYLSQQKEMLKKHESEYKDLKSKLDSDKSNLQKASIEFKNQKSLIENYKKNLSALKEKEDAMTQKLGHMDQILARTKQTVLIAEEVKRCLKSYLSCSFDDALESVSSSATDFLRSIPTMANATIRLVGTKETTSGAVKEQINAVIDNNGEIDIPIKSLSGGEKSAVDMAIDLAVTFLIQEKSNVGCNILCLDEIFGGFDSAGIEQALDMLRNVSTDKKIMIVEHNPIAKEFVSDKIIVTRTEETSALKTA